MAPKVSGSTPSAMCRSSASWRLKSKGEPGTSKPIASHARSRAVSDQIDFDDAAACQMGDANRGPRRQPVRPEILGIDPVEASVVAFEIRKKNAHANNIFEPGAGASERAFEIVHYFASLRLHPFRKRQ